MLNLDKFKNEYLLFDGGMGTMLQSRGLKPGDLPELFNLTHPDVVRGVHREYVEAGSKIITTNTFGANRHKLGDKATPEEVITAAVKLAKEAGAEYVALGLAPTGALLAPLGELSFDEAYDLFKEQVLAGAKAGADLVLIETMSDLLEAKAAVLAAKENCDLPVFVTMTFAEDGRTFLGTTPEIAAATLCGLGVSAVGINCSLGPKQLLPLIRAMAPYATVPLMVQPNAGLPRLEEGKTIFDTTPEIFVSELLPLLDAGVVIVGGCCGTEPGHITLLNKALKERKPSPVKATLCTRITSPQRLVSLNGEVQVIGERINPTGKKKLQEALRTNKDQYILDEAVSQQKAGADLLDVNVGLPGLDETATLKRIVPKIQGISPLPLVLDSSDPVALEEAVRIYSGSPLINSLNGKEESMEAILPLVKKYGASVVCLTLDDVGIPETAAERFAIAEKILNRALSMGIPKERLVIDCLVLSASTNQAMVMETLKTIALVKEKLGLATVLGVSNVSFGLPGREILNSTYLAAALGVGLDMPILNPLSERYMETVAAFRVLNNQDKSAAKYIPFAVAMEARAKVEAEAGAGTSAGTGAKPEGSASDSAGNKPSAGAGAGTKAGSSLADPGAADADAEILKAQSYILDGKKDHIGPATEALLNNYQPLEIINNIFIPALNQLGDEFETGEIFLPQLLTSAETVKIGFDVLKAYTNAQAEQASDSPVKGRILVATVKGDIHDIGKNIVKMLLENYGYEIIDLGKDVDPKLVVETVLSQNIKLVGLSALMTTTLRFMKETIETLKEAGADCRIMVGGAVLNEEYSDMVGADYYAKDAMESVRIAETLFV